MKIYILVEKTPVEINQLHAWMQKTTGKVIGHNNIDGYSIVTAFISRHKEEPRNFFKTTVTNNSKTIVKEVLSPTFDVAFENHQQIIQEIKAESINKINELINSNSGILFVRK